MKKVPIHMHMISQHRHVWDGCWSCNPKVWNKIRPLLGWVSLLLSWTFYFDYGQTPRSYGIRFGLRVWWASWPKHLPVREAGYHNGKITGVMMLSESHGSICLRRGWLCPEMGWVGGLFWVSWKTHCDGELYEEQGLWRENWAGERLNSDAVTSEASTGPTESSEAGRAL